MNIDIEELESEAKEHLFMFNHLDEDVSIRLFKALEQQQARIEELEKSKRIKLTKEHGLEFLFIDGVNQASAFLPYSTIKEYLMDEAMETICTPDCNSSSCAVNNFCECDPINEEMEFSAIYIDTTLPKPPEGKYERINKL